MKAFVSHAGWYYAASFGLVTLAGVAAVGIALRSGEDDLWVSHTFEVRQAADRLLSGMQAAEVSQQGFLLTGNDEYLKAFQQSAPMIPDAIAELRQLTIDNPDQQRRLAGIQAIADQRVGVLRNTLALAQEGDVEQAIALVKASRGKALMDGFMATLQEFSQHELGLLATRQATADTTRRWLLVMVCASLLGALTLAGLLARAAQRGIDGLRERTAELEAEVKLRQHTQDALRQSQKLEAVGHLTGGIAHDFNNLLTIIIGNLDTLKRRLAGFSSGTDATERLEKPIEQAMRGAHNAAQLTHRLLAFARRQALEPTRLDLNHLVSGLSDLLRRTLGERVTMETVLAGGLWPTLADANQLESSLINLCLNARDAMPNGGKLTVETGNAYLDEDYARQFGDVTAGQYVMLSVTDTGVGIAADVLEHVFEPFFTTKPAGEGSGLGLAMVHGFVKQSGGHVRLYSEPGHGTTVKIYLPRLNGAENVATAPAARSPETSVPRAEASDTVLLVEDNAGVRAYARSILEELGYLVQEAGDGAQALRIIEGEARIDLLFTDVVLPGISGRELADQVRARRAGLPVLYTTGYTRNAIVHRGTLDPDVHLLSKPYTQQQLARKLRELLDGR